MNFNIPGSSGAAANASVPNTGVGNMGASSSMNNMGSNSLFNKQMGYILLGILAVAIIVIVIVVIVNRNRNRNNQNIIIDLKKVYYVDFSENSEYFMNKNIPLCIMECFYS